MAARRKSSTPLTRAASKKKISKMSPEKFLSKFGSVEKKPGGSKSLINKNQRKQLEALGYVDPPKKKAAKKKAARRP